MSVKISLGKIIFNPLQLSFEKPIALNDAKVYAANIAGLTKILGVVGIIGLNSMDKMGVIVSIPSGSLFIKNQ